MKYMDINSGEIWTEEEIKETYEQFKDEMPTTFESFEEYLDFLLKLGREKIGGFVKVEDMPYIVYACGGEMDGEELFCTDYDEDAFRYARNHQDDHPLGVFITENGKIMENWE